VEESCDGVNNDCPTDEFEPSTTACGNPAAGDCDADDSCDGAGNCEDLKQPFTTICRESTNVCDPEESCDGLTNDCPIDEIEDLPMLAVIKHVINDDGGSAVAADWTMDITATNPSPNNFPGQESPGVDVTAEPGPYSVDESGGPPDYYKTLGDGCSGELACGDTPECTITNDDLLEICRVQGNRPLKPMALVLTYVGGDGDDTGPCCEPQNAPDFGPDNETFVMGDAGSTDPVCIEVESNVPGNQLVIEGGNMVFIGESFIVRNADPNKRFAPRIIITISDCETGETLETIGFHTSCSDVLNNGDQFGSIVVQGEP
jgi:hypothetical protein